MHNHEVKRLVVRPVARHAKSPTRMRWANSRMHGKMRLTMMTRRRAMVCGVIFLLAAVDYACGVALA